MKRSKKMFTKISSMLHNAVEAFAPEMTLLEQFRYHWKCVTQFFLDTADERIAVENTTIPEHLEQMIEVLKIEEQENGVASAGPSMEFMLQHKILETMQTLGKADCPPGMKRYVLVFFTKLLGKLQQNLLPHVNVHKPVNKLIRCCGNVKAGPTETEEVHFLLQVSSKLKQDSYLVNFFLEKPATDKTLSPPHSPGGIGSDREKPEYSLVDSLLVLTKSEDSRVAIKACEGLLLVTSILEDTAASVIVLYTAFCERMADQLSKLFRSLPQVFDPVDINQANATWGFDHDDQYGNDFVGRRQLTAFLSWLDYVNQLSIEAHPMVSKALAQAIRERFILTAIEPGLSQASEPCAITVTSILTRCLKLVSSPTLAQEFASILLGTDMKPEEPDLQSPHKLRRLLIQRINHLSDQLAVETLRLFQGLLKLPYQPIIDTLVVRNFQNRKYLDMKKLFNANNITRTSSTSSKGSHQLNVNLGAPEQVDIANKTSENAAISTNDDLKVTENNMEKADSEKEDAFTLDNVSKCISDEKKPDDKFTKHSDLTGNDSVSVGQCGNKSTPEEPGQESVNPIQKLVPVLNSSNEIDLVNNDARAMEDSAMEREKTSEKQDDALHETVDNTILESNLNEDDLKGFNKRKLEKAVNGFLLLLPDELRTSSSSETGYDSYLRDAHKQCEQRLDQTSTYTWPPMFSLDNSVEEEEGEFYEGAFLNTIFRRLERMLDQPYEINLEVTGILALLCQFRHPFLHEFLVDTSGHVKDSVFTLHRILLKVCQDMKNRGVRNIQNLTVVRKYLNDNRLQPISELPDQIYLEGIIVFEEFCKELGAITFVSATMVSE